MGIYIFLVVIIGLLSFISTLYIKNATLREYESTLVLRTYNCAEICEGVLRDVVNIMKRQAAHELIVLDKGSDDGTYEILKKLAAKYTFPVLQINDEQEPKEIIEMYSEALGASGGYQLLVMDKDTEYFTARSQINRI
ncbi:glycosyltransferase [Desulfitibacter alkalitolerans]|uniref:glycosyltransferase n=1 Tax=Desulfitibacter alkalitolerans TaxID=264641 RepID=UPI0004814C06|nr:glycosyltransferase [Desulfitibacter alkalitolerans]